VKITFRQASLDDVIRQFRYYLAQADVPEVSVRFKAAVRKTARAIQENPRAAPSYAVNNQQLQNLRSWPIIGFEALPFYFLIDDEAIRVIRILHGKRDIKRILEQEKSV